MLHTGTEVTFKPGYDLFILNIIIDYMLTVFILLLVVILTSQLSRSRYDRYNYCQNQSFTTFLIDWDGQQKDQNELTRSAPKDDHRAVSQSRRQIYIHRGCLDKHIWFYVNVLSWTKTKWHLSKHNFSEIWRASTTYRGNNRTFVFHVLKLCVWKDTKGDKSVSQQIFFKYLYRC